MPISVREVQEPQSFEGAALRDGPNALAHPPRRDFWRRFLGQFKDASLRGGKVAVVEERVPAGSGLAGRALGTIALPSHSAIVAILRDGNLMVAAPDLTFHVGDEIVAVAEVGAEPALAALIGGPSAPARG